MTNPVIYRHETRICTTCGTAYTARKDATNTDCGKCSAKRRNREAQRKRRAKKD